MFPSPRILKPFITQTKFYALFSLSRNSYFEQSGWFQSFSTKQSIDSSKMPIPWMTYSFISFIEKRLSSKMRVFEYGCGNSTLWWATRVKSVVSCEHNYDWHNRVKMISPHNVIIKHCELDSNGSYSQSIRSYGKKFDIVVIDGEERIKCAESCLESLDKDGIIIWDNSDRPEYTEGFSLLHKHGFKRIDFRGAGPINKYDWMTSVFYRKNNCIEI